METSKNFQLHMLGYEVHTRTDPVLPQLLMDKFDTLPIQIHWKLSRRSLMVKFDFEKMSL